MTTEITVEKNKSSSPSTPGRIVLSSALITLVALLGGLAVGIVAGSLAHAGLPDSMEETMRVGFSACPVWPEAPSWDGYLLAPSDLPG